MMSDEENRLQGNKSSLELGETVSMIDWMSGISLNDFHLMLTPYLFPIDLQQLVQVNHFWHDKIRYEIQRFYISDETFTWAKSFEDLSRRAQTVIDDCLLMSSFDSGNETVYMFTIDMGPSIEEEIQSNELQEEIEKDEVDAEGEDESRCSEGEDQVIVIPAEEGSKLSVDSKEEVERKETDGPPPEEMGENQLTEENDDNDYEYYVNFFLRELDSNQGSSHRNISYDQYFFCPENDEYRQDLCGMLSNPAKQLCLYLQNTSLSEFHRFNIRPWKVVFLMTRMHRLREVDLHYLNHIDTVELHGDQSLDSLDGLSGIRVLNISYFTSLLTIGGNLSSLEEVRIRSCLALANLVGLESAKRVTLEGLGNLTELTSIKNCEELHLYKCYAPSIKDLINLRSLIVQECHIFDFEPDLTTMPKLQKLVMLMVPQFEKYPHFPNLQHANVCLHYAVDPLSNLQFLPDLLSLTVNYYTQKTSDIFGGFDQLMVSRFRNLRELTIQGSPSLASVTVMDALPQPLRKIRLVACPLLESLEGLSRVQSVKLEDLQNLRKIAGINPTIKSLSIYSCNIQDWTGVTSVEELTVNYCEQDYDDVSVFPLFGKIVKKKLTLRNSKNINTVIGLEEIPILEFDYCIGLENFSNLKNEKIIIDKVAHCLYSDYVAKFCRLLRYQLESYGDKIVLSRKG